MFGVSVKFKADLRGLQALAKRLGELGVAQVKAGVVGEAATRQHPDSDLTMGDLAVLHEIGSSDGHVPGRHYVRDAMTKNRTAVAGMLRTVAMRVMGSGAVGEGAIHAADWLGKQVAETLRQFILGGEVRPLDAESTRKKKGPLPALVDSMALAEAIGHQVVRSSGSVLEAGASPEAYEGFEYEGEG